LFNRIIYSINDLLYLCKNIRKYDLIHLNPTLDFKALIRDGVYHFIAKKIFRKKTIVFFRGWEASTEKNIEKNFIKIFRVFFNFDYALVLASSFRDKLISWGFKSDIISLETTVFDDAFLEQFAIMRRVKGIGLRERIRLLFLARIEKGKGICETINAVKMLSTVHPEVHLVVAGDGSFIDEAQRLAYEVLGNRVTFLGHVSGEKKKDVLLSSDIYIFPSYSEGMPTSVLEAMAFGLPVVTRPVGGLKDFFINGEHGFISESKEPEVIASLIEKIILDKDLWKRMSINAHEYAKEKFIASKVTQRIEKIYMIIFE
jgi:glycosyltransferase involved in cell wall biosynthesis